MGRPIRRRYHRTPWVALVLALALAVAGRLWLGRSNTDAPREPFTPILNDATYRVHRVVDGDTLLLENRTRVRLLGIDTPEMAREGRPADPISVEAASFTRQFIGDAPVQLRFDHERIDPHGRWLAYVYVDGQMLNEALLRAGLAKVFRKARHSESMKRRFQAAEAEARQNRRGIWNR